MTVIAQTIPEKRQEFLRAINSLYSNKEKENDLKECRLYQEINDLNSFRLVVELETRRDLERHIGEEKFKVLLGALQILCAESEIRYSHLDEEETKVLESKP